MATTGRHMNWTTVTFTPEGGSLVTLTGVQNVEIDPRGSIVTHSGDGDKFPTTKINDFQDPMITVTFRALTILNGLAVGTRGAFSAVHNDARYGVTAASGGYTVAMANAIIENKPSGGQHRQFGDGRLIMTAESTDGLTNPMTFTAL